jgi:hypothetical protein
MILVTGCSGPGQLSDPMTTLGKPRLSPGTHIDAMSRLDGAHPSPAYLKQLKNIVISNTYLMPTRKAAFARLSKYDPKLLETALSNTLMHLAPTEYRVWVIEQIGLANQRGLTKAIIRSWAIPLDFWERDKTRPEPAVLAMMYGEGQVALILMSTMLDADPVIESNLRSRCWELLVAHGNTDSLLVLIRDDELVGKDGLLLDMRAAIDDLHVIPRNREEILWIRSLRTPAHAAYWKKVSAALVQLDDERRKNLEPRDLAVAVAAAEHRPELLRASNQELYDMLASELRGSGRRYTADFSGWTVEVSEDLQDDKGKLTWGDLAAMLLAREALKTEEVRAHIFDFADRDLLDTTTEYGGIIRLDEGGRFEIVEHTPRAKVADDRYLASQALFDEGYTALFHFHNHAQKYRNFRYAGPHLGDIDYANETGANGLVFTFVDAETMNVDFYRHGAIIVDLRTIKRPGNY